VATTYITASQAVISASISGITLPSVYSWSSFEGGDAQSATSQLLPGGMQNAIALPGPVTRTNVTVKVPWTISYQAIVTALEAAVGKSKMSASFQTTDADGNISGTQVTRTGYLKEVQIPSWDSKSGEAVYLGLVMECDV
jgi:predicted permease